MSSAGVWLKAKCSMSDIKHAGFLLKKAEADLRALTGMLASDVFGDEIFGFHAQQAVEKALKALLSFNDISYRKVHDIEELVGLLEEKKITVPKEFKNLVDLTDFAVQFRYESYEDSLPVIKRESLIETVSRFLAFIRESIQGPEE
jgi:HEPN domain-containing protein